MLLAVVRALALAGMDAAMAAAGARYKRWERSARIRHRACFLDRVAASGDHTVILRVRVRLKCWRGRNVAVLLAVARALALARVDWTQQW